ncbi:MAG: glycerol-3-phosphate acyltransferase [Armatimonadota bacterium]
MRKSGSGNIGAINAVRALGFVPGVTVLMADIVTYSRG